MKLQATYLAPEDITRVQEIAAILQKDVSRHHSIPDLASRVFMNRLKFQEVFAAVYNMGPFTYLQELRLEKAKNMLVSNYTMRQISVAIGYKKQGANTSFIRFFKKHTGITPLEWRKRHRVRKAV